MKRIYISGKITGLPLHEAQQLFANAAKQIQAAGHTPLNPMEMVKYAPEKQWAEYMKEDIAILMTADEIYMLSNWQHSKGARIEHDLAIKMQIGIVYEAQPKTIRRSIPLLNEIGKAYESAKDCVHAIQYNYATDRQKNEVYDHIVTLRNIAATCAADLSTHTYANAATHTY